MAGRGMDALPQYLDNPPTLDIMTDMLQMIHGHGDGIDLGTFTVDRTYGCKRTSGSDRWLMFATTTGAGRIAANAGWLEAMPGSLHLIRPRTRHDYATTAEPGRWGFHWAWFTPQAGWLPWLDWGAGAGGVSALSPGPEAFSCIAGAMAEAVRHACSGAPCSGALAANSIERALILARSADAGAGLDVRVRRALAILHQEPDGDLSLARLAVRCQTSVSRLTAAFRSAMGVSVHAYREHLRLARAERLLRHSRLSISAIAEACGYPDPFHFSRRFRRHAGMSPRVWRSQAQA